MKSVANTRFLRDHPRRRKNVFLMMGFEPTPMRARAHEIIVNTGNSLGLDVLRADDADYSGELWANARVCLDNAALGIAVFDCGDHSAQNLSVELGYLFAKAVPCLILRERALSSPPAMLAHRLHTPFDAFDLDSTLTVPVRRWLAEQLTGARRFTRLR